MIHLDILDVRPRQVLDSVRCDRAQFDATLASAEQAALRAPNKAEGRAMRAYVGEHPSLADGPEFAEMLAAADSCCERLQPALGDISADDAEMAKRFPFHSASAPGETGVKRGAPASDSVEQLDADAEAPRRGRQQ